MADEKNENDKTVTGGTDTKPGTTTVKKKAAKKKVAKKSAAKKKASTKKAVSKKAAAKPDAAKPAPSPTQEVKQQPASTADSQTKMESKPATPTSVAAAASAVGGAEKKPVTAPKDDSPASHDTASSNVIVQTQFKKTEPVEDSSMSTETKSAGGFWVKVIFWLIIIVLAFIYIRTLAKNPAQDATGSAQTTSNVMYPGAGNSAPVSQASDDTAAAGQADNADQAAAATAEGDASGLSADSSASGGQAAAPASETATETVTEIVLEAVPQEEATADAATGQGPGADSGSTEDQMAASAADAASGAAYAQPPSANTADAMRDMHAESVSKILKEFDDLRTAAQAEMEAMRNLRQAEQELRDAMAPPPPVYPPAWGAPPGYGPYGNTPQYPPY